MLDYSNTEGMWIDLSSYTLEELKELYSIMNNQDSLCNEVLARIEDMENENG